MQGVGESLFTLPTLEMATELIGYYLVHNVDEELLIGRIVETEAYKGPQDRAAHSYNNLRTKRTEVMFHRAGLFYTYQMHTHTLINIVSGKTNEPEAVLIRAIEPVAGVETMRLNRGPRIDVRNLTNGPGKLTQALGITMDYYGHCAKEQPLYICEGEKGGEIDCSERIGIANSGEAVHYPWRFFEKNNPFVSR